MNPRPIPPVLLLAYRRADTTRKVIDALRLVEAPNIFFAVDGPKPGEEADCEKVRNLAKTIDWKCEVHTNFRRKNTGLRDAVESSILWFFNHVAEGIVLEDDCVPSNDFFPFCSEMLEVYRDDPRIMHVSGNNHDRSPFPESYRFSRYPHIWGWATWAEAWKKNRTLGRAELTAALSEHFPNRQEQTYWRLLYEIVDSGKIDTWDFPWLLSLLAEDGWCVTPQKNLVTNIGFGDGATHTTQKNNPHSNAAIGELAFPLTHPEVIEIDTTRDREVADELYQIGASANSGHAKIRLIKALPVSLKRWLKNRFVK